MDNRRISHSAWFWLELNVLYNQNKLKIHYDLAEMASLKSQWTRENSVNAHKEVFIYREWP